MTIFMYLPLWLALAILIALGGCSSGNPHPRHTALWYQHEQLEESKRLRRSQHLDHGFYGRSYRGRSWNRGRWQ